MLMCEFAARRRKPNTGNAHKPYVCMHVDLTPPPPPNKEEEKEQSEERERGEEGEEGGLQASYHPLPLFISHSRSLIHFPYPEGRCNADNRLPDSFFTLPWTPKIATRAGKL